MTHTKKLSGRRALPVLALGTALALGVGFAVDTARASAQAVNPQQEVSGNWSGYIVHSSNGQNFSNVSGSWTQPSVATSAPGYSAFWVGLGGAGQQSQSLEQVGTAADRTNGQTTYYAWYELVPAAEVKLDLAIHPGDQMSGRVTVNGTNVMISLSDKTTGQSVTKALTMSAPDTSSAEWVAEAPSAQSASGDIQTLPLADFGNVTFTNTSATAGEHSGPVSDSSWTVEQVAMQPSGAGAGGVIGGGRFSPTGLEEISQSSSAGASASSVSSDGSSFTVTYSMSPAQSSSDSSGDGGGYSGSGYPGPYDDPGYGYPGGYIYGY